MVGAPVVDVLLNDSCLLFAIASPMFSIVANATMEEASPIISELVGDPIQSIIRDDLLIVLRGIDYLSYIEDSTDLVEIELKTVFVSKRSVFSH